MKKLQMKHRFQAFGISLLPLLTASLAGACITSFLWVGLLAGYFYGGRYGLIAAAGILLVEFLLSALFGFLKSFPVMEKRAEVFKRKGAKYMGQDQAKLFFFWSFYENYQFLFWFLCIAIAFVLVVFGIGFSFIWVPILVAHFYGGETGFYAFFVILIGLGLVDAILDSKETNPLIRKLQDENLKRLYS